MAYKDVILKDGPVGYWRMDDITAVASDFSGSGFPGSYIGDVQQAQPGLIQGDGDTCAAFNPSSYGLGAASGYVSVPSAGGLLPGAFTIEAWSVPFNPGASDQMLISMRAGQAGVVMNLHGAALRCNVFNGVGNQTAQGRTVTASQSAHAAAVFNGSQLMLYQNGASVANVGASYLPGGSDLSIGRDPHANVMPFFGLLDEVAIYPYALTPSQVAKHYLVGSGQQEMRWVGPWPVAEVSVGSSSPLIFYGSGSTQLVPGSVASGAAKADPGWWAFD